jgi:uncharacterized iron-regulated membrane protein
MLKWSLQLHKWLALVVGIQVLFWVAGGLVMTAIPIEKVRGEHHRADFQLPPPDLRAAKSPADIAAGAGLAPNEATLKSTVRGYYWILKTADGKSHVFDAVTGAPAPPVAPGEVRQLAGAAYEGAGKPMAAKYFRSAPQETGREGPVWRVDFDDAERTALYLSPDTGEVVSRRSNLWRIYDVFWRLHILDFKTGENFNHPLLIALAALTLPMVITGWVLLVIRLGRDAKRLRPRPAAI